VSTVGLIGIILAVVITITKPGLKDAMLVGTLKQHKDLWKNKSIKIIKKDIVNINIKQLVINVWREVRDLVHCKV
jgi:hypothetical protein